MGRSNLLSAVFLAALVHAGETVRKPENYPVRTKVGNLTMAAENLGPSVPTPSGGLFTTDYIVIEVALFGEGRGQTVSVTHRQFALRINGQKSLLRPDTPGAVAASIKYPDWEQQRHLEVTAGPVIIGRPVPVERFPGDRRPTEGRVSRPRVENPVERKPDPTSVDELVRDAALFEGEMPLPASGCLYFPYKKKMKTIKKLELVYDGPIGEGSLRLP